MGDVFVIETSSGILWGPFETPTKAIAWAKREKFTYRAIRPVTQPIMDTK